MLVISRGVATGGRAIVLVICVTTFTAVPSSAVRAHIDVCLDVVPHCCRLEAVLDQALCHIARLYNKSNHDGGNVLVLRSHFDGAKV
jgi:hypothetical protein